MYRYLRGCDLWTIGHEVVLEHAPSLPLSPYFFHQSVIPKFPVIFSKFSTVLLMKEYANEGSTSILATSYLVLEMSLSALLED